MQADTIFDLASLTKVVATTTVTLALAGRGELALGDPVAGYLPDARACRDGHVTIAHLLTHTSECRGDGTAWTGTVHDENARLLGGVAGHAGLFAPAADLARFAAWWVSSGDAVVPAALRRAAATCQTEGLGGRRGYGWACSGDAFDILSGRWPPTAVSHTGFTGTSLALDPVSGVWMVLLTNAVHAGRDATAVKALRRAVHEAVRVTASTPP
jgi:CubicO group peptidase (beta-lactamase class C family)